MAFDSHPRVYQIEGNDLEMIKSWFKLLGEEVYSLRIMPRGRSSAPPSRTCWRV
jgi:hypothetical protein